MTCSSEIAPLHHEFFGLPLFRFPWGFHSKVCFVMLLLAFLSVFPIHFHRLDLIVKLIGCYFVFLHSSLLLMVSGHLTPKIVLRQRFRKTWSALIEDAVSLHVAEPLRRIYFTLELMSLSLVLVFKVVLLQTGKGLLSLSFPSFDVIVGFPSSADDAAYSVFGRSRYVTDIIRY